MSDIDVAGVCLVDDEGRFLFFSLTSTEESPNGKE
jgi:hypothetical protein